MDYCCVFVFVINFILLNKKESDGLKFIVFEIKGVIDFFLVDVFSFIMTLFFRNIWFFLFINFILKIKYNLEVEFVVKKKKREIIILYIVRVLLL